MILFISLVFGQTVLYEKPTVSISDKQSINTEKEQKTKTKKYKGNLPNYHVRQKGKVEFLSLNSEVEVNVSNFFKSGKTYVISLVEDIYLPVNKEVPITGIYKNGLRFVSLEGTARLNPDKKSANIKFHKFNLGEHSYNFLAKAYTGNGSVNVDYNSKESSYFAADLLSVAVAAYFDARIPRTTNAFGNRVVDDSVDSALKTGVSAAFLESSKRIKNQMNQDQPYGLINKNINIKILILKKGVTK